MAFDSRPGRGAGCEGARQKKTRSRGAGKSILWEGGGDRENYTGGPALLEISISNIQYHCGE
jgi:hypothetical protein